MTESNSTAHADMRSRQVDMVDGGMMVYAALTQGDRVNARRLADWLFSSALERLSIEVAETRLVHLVHNTILKA